MLRTCYGEVAINLLRTCYGETGVMDFGSNWFGFLATKNKESGSRSDVVSSVRFGSVWILQIFSTVLSSVCFKTIKRGLSKIHYLSGVAESECDVPSCTPFIDRLVR